MSVIGSAKPGDVSRANLTYDAVDDAIISSEQGATIILDYLKINAYFCIGVLKIWR